MTTTEARGRIVEVRAVLSSLTDLLQGDVKLLTQAVNQSGMWLLGSANAVFSALPSQVQEELDRSMPSGLTPLVDIVYFANAGMEKELIEAVKQIPAINTTLDKIAEALSEEAPK
jgi:hypothetical protein